MQFHAIIISSEVSDSLLALWYLRWAPDTPPSSHSEGEALTIGEGISCCTIVMWHDRSFSGWALSLLTRLGYNGSPLLPVRCVGRAPLGCTSCLLSKLVVDAVARVDLACMHAQKRKVSGSNAHAPCKKCTA